MGTTIETRVSLIEGADYALLKSVKISKKKYTYLIKVEEVDSSSIAKLYRYYDNTEDKEEIVRGEIKKTQSQAYHDLAVRLIAEGILAIDEKGDTRLV
jgi:hypothetical protein